MTRTHAVLAAIRRVHDRVRANGDSGTTTIELFVAMIIMAIAGSIFVGAVVTLSRTTNHAQAVTNSATNNNKAYQALDRTVRYASAISTPGISYRREQVLVRRAAGHHQRRGGSAPSSASTSPANSCNGGRGRRRTSRR